LAFSFIVARSISPAAIRSSTGIVFAIVSSIATRASGFGLRST
jgi:hypothetical protein